MRNTKKFETTKAVISRIGIKNYLVSRFLTIGQIADGIKNEPMDLKASKNLRQLLGSILFNARYEAGKAILGYDFV